MQSRLNIPPCLRNIAGLVGPDKQTIVWPAAEALTVLSDGSSTGRSMDITAPPFDEIGPFIQSVQAYTATEAKSANFRWKAQAAGSTTGRSFGTAFDLFAWLTAATETTETAYSSVSTFGLKSRYALIGANVTGTAIESAVVWLYLVFHLRT